MIGTLVLIVSTVILIIGLGCLFWLVVLELFFNWASDGRESFIEDMIELFKRR